jgi:nucleoside-diphosphate-sugar epimerase
MKKILVTGGCGYVGSKLVNALKKKYFVKVIDIQWFGNHLNNDKNLIIERADIRELGSDFIDKDFYAVIHLANIANDPAVELNQALSWEVNVLAAKKLVETSILHGVKKFIYASSGSVYGIKKEEKVTEDLDLLPISTYNKTKMICERLLQSYQDQISIYNIRPATVCGLSPRMRFDVSVNMLTLQALQHNEINIFGGSQIRPNIHIDDLVRVYEHFLEEKIKPGNYNAGFENLTITEIAKKIQDKIYCKINFTESNDPRSYRQCSEKLLKTNFRPKKKVSNAIDEIINAYDKKNIKIDDTCFTINWMKKILS